jgi:hypothetical protein
MTNVSQELLWTWTMCSRELTQTWMKDVRTYSSGMQRPLIQVLACPATGPTQVYLYPGMGTLRTL